MSFGYRCVAAGLALALGAIAIGLIRGTIPLSLKGTDEQITGSPAVIAGVLTLAGACRILYAAFTGH